MTRLQTLGSDDAVAAQTAALKRTPYINELLSALPIVAFVVNRDRQVVLGNEALSRLIADPEFDKLLGQRHGELLRCSNAHTPGGCGASQQCRLCGAINAITDCQEQQTKVSREFRLALRRGDAIEAREFFVTASPVEVEGFPGLTLVTLLDISDEKRRRNLERIFLHDIINSIGGLRGLSKFLLNCSEEEKKTLLPQVTTTVDQILDEVLAQRDLAAAENHELAVTPREVSAREIVEAAVRVVRQHDVAAGKTISFEPGPGDVSLVTDRRLAGRVLINLLKNGAEASHPGETVSAGFSIQESAVEFTVHNPAVVPPEVQLQIFQRTFSTKGDGRGLGTYGAKLLTERYLGGEIWFTSRSGEGTVFHVRLPRPAAA